MAEYAVSFRRSAEKDLRRLDASVQQRVLRAVEALAVTPRPPGCKMLHGAEDTYRIRVGDWRVVFVVDDNLRHVAIERIRHRSDVYR